MLSKFDKLNGCFVAGFDARVHGEGYLGEANGSWEWVVRGALDGEGVNHGVGHVLGSVVGSVGAKA